MGRNSARIGTSGWSYPGWRNDFYAGVPQRRWLAHCAERFTGIEVNATFYRQIRSEIVARWRGETPGDFVFAVKGHKMVTHNLRLREAEESVGRMRTALNALGDKLAVVFWQLPPNFAKDIARLEGFAATLARWPEVRHAIEFRHPSWFDSETAAALGAGGLANCLSDAATWPLWEAVTTDLVYVRLHGHERTYASAYGEAGLKPWAKRVRRWLAEGRMVHVYFDNDLEGAAPRDAVGLIGMLGDTE